MNRDLRKSSKSRRGTWVGDKVYKKAGEKKG